MRTLSSKGFASSGPYRFIGGARARLFLRLLVPALLLTHSVRADGLLPEYEAWATAQSIPSDQRGYDATPADDGVPNLVKFAVGSNALDAVDGSTLFSYVMDHQSRSIEMEFARHVQATNVVLMPQWAPTLDGDWRSYEYGLEQISASGDYEVWHAGLPFHESGFWRLAAGVGDALLRNRYRSPFAVAYSPDGTWLAATDREQGVVYFIDPSAETPAVEHRVVMHGRPCGLSWGSGNTLYVAEYGAGTVAEIRFVSGSPQVVRRIDTGSMPYSLQAAPGRNVLLVADFGLNDIRAIDLATGETFNRVALPGNASFMAIDDTETTAVVGILTPGSESAFELVNASRVSIIDVLSGNLLANVALPPGSSNVRDVRISPDGNWAYVVHTYGSVALPTLKLDSGWVNSNVITIIDLNAKTRLTTIPLDLANEGWANPWGLAVSADGASLWITSDGVHKLGRLKLAELHAHLDGSINGGGGGGSTDLTFTVTPNGSTYDVLIQWPAFTGDPNFNSDGYDDNYSIYRDGNKVTDWPGKPLPTSYLNTGVPEGLHLYEVFPYEGNKDNRIGRYAGTVAVGNVPAPPILGNDIWEEIWRGNEPLTALQHHYAALNGRGLFNSIDLRNSRDELCKGPRGIDISPAGDELAVAAYFSGQILLLDPETGKALQTIDLGPQPPKDSIRRGEEYFADGTISRQHWLACTTCHPGARTDGLNWDLGNDGLGSYKNTKSLVGAEYTAPTTWTGVRSGATASVRAGFIHIHYAEVPLQVSDDTQAYLASLRPDRSPYLNHGVLTPLARRGREVFVQQGCADCHNGAWYTDLTIYDVGTGRTEDMGATAFDTPGIQELWRTGPFFHDGRFGGIDETVQAGAGWAHQTAIPADDLEALIEYLKSL